MKLINPEKFRKVPDGVLFDTDNTLYPYEPARKAAEEALVSKMFTELSVARKDFEAIYKEARVQIKTLLGETASSHSRLLYFQRMLELMGLGSQVLLSLDLEQTYWRTFLANAIVFDGVKEVLDELRLRKVKTAVVTDLTSQIQFRKLIYFGLDHYFDFIVTSEEAGADKPNKAPFDLALNKMGLTASDNIWMVGDNLKSDITGAKQAIGATTIWKRDFKVSGGSIPQDVDGCLSDFVELAFLFRNLK